jgi:hypothetical protein
MAFYNASVTTKIIDPQFHQSLYRDEMRIQEEGLYGTNMRILNLGVLANGDSFTANRTFNKLTGSHGVIQNIYLYDGKVVLDSVYDYKDFGAFQKYNNNNNANSDIQKVLSRNGLGFVYDSDAFNPAGALTLPKIKEFNSQNGGHFVHTSNESSPTGFLNLRDVFPLLQRLDFLHTGLFKNLRVVIEYNKADALTYNASGDVTATNIPILVVDQYVDAQMANKWLASFKSVVWDAVELETVQLPAMGTSSQSSKYRLNNFGGKTLQKLLLQKKATTVSSALYNLEGSETMFGESIQVFVDNSAVLPDSGIVSPNQRLALLTDTFSECNAHPSSANLSMYNASTSIDDYENRVGHLDYFGMTIGKKIGSLDVTFGREYVTDLSAVYKQALILNFFGFVTKAIVASKGSYQVIYV